MTSEAAALDTFLRESAEAELLREAERPGRTEEGDTLTLVGQPGQLDIPSLMAEHGLDPEEWIPERTVVNRWQQHSVIAGTVTLRQLKVFFRRAIQYRLILPAPLPQEPHPALGCQIEPKGAIQRPTLTIVTTDAQAPFHDERLHQLTLAFARDVKPDEWVDLGDLVDLDALSRFREKPDWKSSLQEGINAGARILWERRQAAGKRCRMRLIEGNHDARLQTYLLDNAKALFGVRRAEIGPPEHESVLDFGYLLRLKELGVELVRSNAGMGYPHSSVEIAPGLIGIHGEKVRSGSGNSVRAAMRRRHCSIACGHVNKLSAISEVRYGADGRPQTLWAIEAGMIGRTDGGMGFAGNDPDWQAGFLTISTFPDGSWHPELIPYTDGAIRWRGRKWELAG